MTISDAERKEFMDKQSYRPGPRYSGDTEYMHYDSEGNWTGPVPDSDVPVNGYRADLLAGEDPVTFHEASSQIYSWPTDDYGNSPRISEDQAEEWRFNFAARVADLGYVCGWREGDHAAMIYNLGAHYGDSPVFVHRSTDSAYSWLRAEERERTKRRMASEDRTRRAKEATEAITGLDNPANHPAYIAALEARLAALEAQLGGA